PQYDSESYTVGEYEEISAGKTQNTYRDIRSDLRALYKSMIKLSDTTVRGVERWEFESRTLEKQLVDIEERIENLLILNQDIVGYASVIIDNFTDTSLVDLNVSDANVDIVAGNVSLSPTPGSEARIFLNNLEDSDV